MAGSECGELQTRTKNQYGVAEWRVWPNKEIAEALAQKQGGKVEGSTDAINFSPSGSDTVEAEEVAYNEGDESYDELTTWRQVEIERLELMAEKLVKPLAERIEAQAVTMREQEKIIEEQNRQLRLLPDLQKQAEQERKAAESGVLENQALKKQIAALQEEQKAKEAKLEKVESLQSQLKVLNEQLQKLQRPWWKKMFEGQ